MYNFYFVHRLLKLYYYCRYFFVIKRYIYIYINITFINVGNKGYYKYLVEHNSQTHSFTWFTFFLQKSIIPPKEAGTSFTCPFVVLTLREYLGVLSLSMQTAFCSLRAREDPSVLILTNVTRRSSTAL